MTGGEAGKNWNTENPQVFLKQRVGNALCVSFFAFFIRKSTQQNAGNRRQLTRQFKLRQIPVDSIRALADVLQKQNPALSVDLKRRSDDSAYHGEISAD